MADKTINIKLIPRHDTEANWKAADPVLLDGELGFSSDKNNMFKVGDGKSKWSALPYCSALKDSAGQQINTTYIKGLSVNGKTITYTKGDGTTGTITTQDTNTWRGIQNNLTSTVTDQSLSAAQGKILNEKFVNYVPTSRTINGKSLSANISLSASDVGASASGHTPDDRYYTESEIDTKLNSKVNKNLSSFNDILVPVTKSTIILPEKNSLATNPFARDFWHDHFAFLQGYTITLNQTTTDGNTWTDSTTSLTGLFCQKEKVATQILSKDILARRFVLTSNNLAYSMISWFELGVAFSKPFSNFSVLIEKSVDNSSWVTVNSTTITNNSNPYFLYGYIGDASKYARFTFTKTTNINTGTASLTCIKGFSSRKGDQGQGIENEYPYNWDANRNIFPVENNTNILGSSSSKWRAVYATSFEGNATSATKLVTSAGSSTRPVYFSDGKPVQTTYTLNKDVPSDAKFTDTVYTHPITSGNKHIPSGGSAGQILRWSADGTATWGADNNTTYSTATTSVNGLMSASDKTKLDGIATGANKYSHPAYTAKSSGLYKVTVDATGHVSATTAVTKSDITNLGIPASNTWRGVQDNLTSTATDQSLSANQGRLLKSYIDNHTSILTDLQNTVLQVAGDVWTEATEFDIDAIFE